MNGSRVNMKTRTPVYKKSTAKHIYAYRLGAKSLGLVAPSLSLARARTLAVDLAYAMVKFDITNKRRAAMFIAQICHESAEFRYTEEIADGSAYEGRRDLGNTHTGDGKRYKGRSFMQITGRANYAAISKALGVDFVAHPEKLAEQKWACYAAAWWWKTHGCNELADRGSVLAVTRRINGGTNGLFQRARYYAKALPIAAYLVPKRRKPA